MTETKKQTPASAVENDKTGYDLPSVMKVIAGIVDSYGKYGHLAIDEYAKLVIQTPPGKMALFNEKICRMVDDLVDLKPNESIEERGKTLAALLRLLNVDKPQPPCSAEFKKRVDELVYGAMLWIGVEPIKKLELRSDNKPPAPLRDGSTFTFAPGTRARVRTVRPSNDGGIYSAWALELTESGTTGI